MSGFLLVYVTSWRLSLHTLLYYCVRVVCVCVCVCVCVFVCLCVCVFKRSLSHLCVPFVSVYMHTYICKYTLNNK